MLHGADAAAAGDADHDGQADLPERAEPHLRELAHDLIYGGEHEPVELDLAPGAVAAPSVPTSSPMTSTLGSLSSALRSPSLIALDRVSVLIGPRPSSPRLRTSPGRRHTARVRHRAARAARHTRSRRWLVARGRASPGKPGGPRRRPGLPRRRCARRNW